MKTLTDAVKDNLATQDCLTKILDAQTRRNYTPNSNGPRDYFKECEVDACMAKRLRQAIGINTTMLYSQRAFSRAHPDSTVEIRKLMAEWVDVKDRISKADKAKTPPTQATPAALYVKFKAHYSNKIK